MCTHNGFTKHQQKESFDDYEYHSNIFIGQLCVFITKLFFIFVDNDSILMKTALTQ